jgi:hypothetical protein
MTVKEETVSAPSQDLLFDWLQSQHPEWRDDELVTVPVIAERLGMSESGVRHWFYRPMPTYTGKRPEPDDVTPTNGELWYRWGDFADWYRTGTRRRRPPGGLPAPHWVTLVRVVDGGVRELERPPGGRKDVMPPLAHGLQRRWVNPLIIKGLVQVLPDGSIVPTETGRGLVAAAPIWAGWARSVDPADPPERVTAPQIKGEEIPRPDGTVYRARSLPTAEVFGDSPDVACVVVWRTHDPRVAAPLAREEWANMWGANAKLPEHERAGWFHAVRISHIHEMVMRSTPGAQYAPGMCDRIVDRDAAEHGAVPGVLFDHTDSPRME